MEKYFKINKSPYNRTWKDTEKEVVCVYTKYDKNKGGYCAVSEIRGISITNGITLFSKMFCAAYYRHDGDGIVLLIPAGRKNAKREAEAERLCAEKAAMYAHNFVDHINKCLNTDIEIIEEG